MEKGDMGAWIPNAGREDVPVCPWPWQNGLPMMYGDEDYEALGDSDTHVTVHGIFHLGLKAHLKKTRYRVFADLTLFRDPRLYPRFASPDIMVFDSLTDWDDQEIGYSYPHNGPPPILVGEVLSARSAAQGDLTSKFEMYAQLGIPEYLVVDPSGQWLAQRLLRIRFSGDGTHQLDQDADGGLTSALGFRLILDTDGQLRVVDAVTGFPYRRPEEAEEEARSRNDLEAQLQAMKQQVQILKVEIQHLREGR